MLSSPARHRLRRLGQAVAAAPAVAVLLSAPVALADTPEGWPEAEPVSTLSTLLLLAGIPVALIAVIALLVYVPSMARGDRYTPGLAWHNKNEWFGGPSGGVEAAESAERPALEAGEVEAGGASARW